MESGTEASLCLRPTLSRKTHHTSRPDPMDRRFPIRDSACAERFRPLSPKENIILPTFCGLFSVLGSREKIRATSMRPGSPFYKTQYRQRTFCAAYYKILEGGRRGRVVSKFMWRHRPGALVRLLPYLSCVLNTLQFPIAVRS
jgi:hypothetical protein